MKSTLIHSLTISMICLVSFTVLGQTDFKELRKKADKLYQQGNYKEALTIFKKIALEDDSLSKQPGESMGMAIHCLKKLNQTNKIDEFREKVIKGHTNNWRLLKAAADSYQQEVHYGYMIAGKFERGPHRGGGDYVNCIERDHVRALQLLNQALPIVEKNATANEQYYFYLQFANTILANRGYGQSWRLQYLTDLSKLPDYEKSYYYGYRYNRGNSRGAPVNVAGMPVYYYIPKTFADAKNDGERWRWLLEAAKKAVPGKADSVNLKLADFLMNQFGVQTMSSYLRSANRSGQQKDREKDGPYSVHTLAEDETIARLATGIKRFKLPAEFNFIKIYQNVSKAKNSNGERALYKLSEIFTNRRQYPKAAMYWRENIKRFGPGHNNQKQKSLNQIIGNWGQFETLRPFAAGTPATVDFRFRNADKVFFHARKIKVNMLLDDIKKYLKSNPKTIDWKEINIHNIGYRLVTQNEAKYIGGDAAKWTIKLQPRKNHFDRLITVDTPLKDAGAYLLTATLQNGNTSRIVIWLTNTVILSRPLSNRNLYYVADATTGKPVPKAKLDVFGYRQEHIPRRQWKKNSGRRYNTQVKEFETHTGKNGLAIFSNKDISNRFRWLITASTADGHFAFVGFNNIWFNRRYDQQYNQTKTFFISDRPVYRPKQTVKYKFWVRKAQYDMKDTSQFAHQSFTVIIRNPKNEEIYKKVITADAFGGLNGEFNIPDDATLGVYRIYLKNYGGGSFRIEEYKKPEYEVKVNAPKEPVKLGDKITAVIEAKYYFGAPVTNATVKYKVLRYDHTTQWYPPRYWDWLYSPGYWWFSCDTPWYPGWRRWGCKCPYPWWMPRRNTPPELVMENETKIGPDGKVKVEIDSSVAKEFHGDIDHRYEITAEVVDLSRRTIVGKGSVIAALQPFNVYAWVNRGYYRFGDTITAHFSARTVDGKPVKGKGELKLLKISYDSSGTPSEKEVRKWSLDTNPEGRASLKMSATETGQFRLSYVLKDKKGNSIEGGYLFNIYGKGYDSGKFRYNALELINDKGEYAPGDKANLMINTDRVNSTVLLFVRPTNGVYLTPKIISLNGKTAFEEIAITTKDMPNLFVEAVTVSDGKIHTVVKELVVPPEKRVLNVEIMPGKEKYKPGEKAKVKLKITDYFGRPVPGNTVVTIYDKSVEYISGGSNIQAIKPFFWKWRRRHYTSGFSNINRYFGNLWKKNEIRMRFLGVFGNLIQPEKKQDSVGFGAGNLRARRKGGRALAEGLAPSMPMKKSKMMLSAVADKAEMKEMEVQTGKDGKPGSNASDDTGSDVHVRKEFADTAYWTASLTADKNGEAEIELDMPENLTTWKIKVWSLMAGTKVGQGETEVVTSKDFIIRLQSPRFFIETDEVVLSAVVHNYHTDTKVAKVSLELGGKSLKALDPSKNTQTVTIKSHGDARINWTVSAEKEGEAVITMKAVTDNDGDAMQMKFPVYVHGILKTVSFSGNIRPKGKSAEITIDVPEARRIEESRLEIRYSPTLAGAMVDALPYLVSYPYGCTEQTLNRFLPTVITQNILRGLGLNLDKIKDNQTNLNAQEIGDPKKRAKQWKRWKHNPVFDDEKVKDMVNEGIKRLEYMQISDGGWGWFSGYGEYSYPHTTALVVHGLQIAKQNKVKFNPQMLTRGIKWLQIYQEREVRKLKNAEKKIKPWKNYASNLDAYVYMVLVDANIKNNDMLNFLYRDRTKLSVYAKAVFGIALHHQKLTEKLTMIIRNIEQYLTTDKENQTAWLNLPNSGYWWYWYGSEFEAHAYYLKLLALTKPKSETAAWLVKYLLNNRKHATYWNSTRDTAICIEALADYLKASGEDRPDMTVEILIDGKVRKTVKINSENLFTFDGSLLLTGKEIRSGKSKIVIRRQGKGPVYFNAYLTYFSLEKFIKKAGLEIKVERKYYKLKKVDKSIKVSGARGQALDQKVEKYERLPLANLAELKSGDLVEIELIMQSKNDYEYLVFEDFKAAGFEPCEVRSGYNGNAMGAYVEFRDEKVCFFVRQLARGKHSLSYRMRAEIPGKFSALPTKGYAMYAPELRANSDEIKLQVKD